uniref:DCD domain-containing protein n=1 Tax=Leersia perrieri TaxID=77586 RepID=A0A0D9WMG1_9ORYZ
MAAVEEEERWKAEAEEEEEMEVVMGVEGAMEEGEIGGGFGKEEEGNGDAGKGEEGGAGAGDRRVWREKATKKQKHHHHHHQPRTPVTAESRGSWRGKGGGAGRGGGGKFHHHRPRNPHQYTLNKFNRPGVYGGAIIICNHMIKREFFHEELFALPSYAASFIKKIRVGMLLFVFVREERKLYGVFEATSDGALDILPDAFTSLRKPRPAQVLFRRVWFCKPLTETEFSSAVDGNCLRPEMTFFGVSYQQVLDLVDLFASKMIRLQSYQKSKSRVIWDYKISLGHLVQEFSPHTHNRTFSSHSSTIFCNNRSPLPRSSFMDTKQNAKHHACKYESPLHSPLKSVIFKEPDVKGESLEPNADFIPLEVDDCKSDSDAALSDILETVSFYSAQEGCISCEDQDLKPFNGKFNGDDGHRSHVLIPGFNSECETSRNSVSSHIVKERQSSLQAKGCKRKAVHEFDEHSSPMRGCTMTKRVSFSFSGEEISVTSEQALNRPSTELDQTRKASIEEEKQDVGCLVQKTQSKGEDVSAKIKLMSLSLPEGLESRVRSYSSNSQSLEIRREQKRSEKPPRKYSSQEKPSSRTHPSPIDNLATALHDQTRDTHPCLHCLVAQSKEGSTYDGAIFLCNRQTRRECFEKKLFGLSAHCASFIHRVKVGATLFLYDVDQHKLHGVFEATSDGSMNIIPDAYVSSGKPYPCQISFKRIWFCKPLMENEYRDAIQKKFMPKSKFTYGLSHQQVVRLLHLFSSRNRLKPRQNQNMQDELTKESEMSSLVNQTDIQSSSNSSSHGSFKSPCQTCSSSTNGEHAATLSHKLADPMPLVHRGLKPEASGVVKSKDSSRFSMHTGANTEIVTVPISQEAMDDRSSDDYIPLPQEENTLESIDDLSDLLQDESYFSGSQDNSDSEDDSTFHQTFTTKDDECCPPAVNSKLRSDTEERTSVFYRLLGKPKTFGPRKKSKAKAFPSMDAVSFGHLPRRKKQWRKQHSKPFPSDRGGMLGTDPVSKLSRGPALDYSFVWDDSRSTNFLGEKPSKDHTSLGPLLCEHGNKLDICTKEHSRCNESKRLFVPEAIRKLIRPCEKQINIPPVFPGVHDGDEVNPKEEVNDTLGSERGKDDQDFGDENENENVEEATRKKRRLEDVSFSQEEYESGAALVPEGAKDMDMLAIYDGNCKDESICLSSRDTCAEMARDYIQTKVVLRDEQKNIQDCCEEVTSLVLENSENMESLPKHSCRDRKICLNVETKSQVASGNLETRSLQDTQDQSAMSCHGVINGDKILLLENFVTMDLLPDHDDDCLTKSTFVGNDRHIASDHLETEMTLQEKQTPSVQNSCEVLHSDNMLIQEMSYDILSKIDADCEKKKRISFDEAYSNVEASSLETHVSLREPCQMASNCREIVNADQVLAPEDSVILVIPSKCDGECDKKSFSLDENGDYVTCNTLSVGKGQHENIQSCGELVTCNTMSTLENPMAIGTVESSHGDNGNNGNSSAACKSLGSDCLEEADQLVTNCSEVSAVVPESSGPLINFSKCYGDSANKNSLLDETSENVSTDHQETSILPQDEHYNSCSGDTSSALEYFGTMGTNTGDGDSEQKNSFDQKDGEVIYSVTGVMLRAEQHNKFQGDPESSFNENSNSTDSFAVCAEDSRSKSGVSADRVVVDLLGINSESRTSFFNGSSIECGENLSGSASSGENAQQKLNKSGVSAEVTRLQHDPGE